MRAINDAVRVAFEVALTPGASLPLPPMQSALATCDAWGDQVVSRLEELAAELSEDLHRTIGYPEGLPGEACLADIDRVLWSDAIRGALSALAQWRGDSAATLYQLRVILVTIHILALEFRALRRTAGVIEHVLPVAALAQLIRDANPGIWGGDRHDGSVRKALKDAVAAYDLDAVGYLRANVMPDFELDLAAAIVLLHESEPATCAEAVSDARSVLTGMLVLHVLEEDALAFALRTTDPVLQFLAVLRAHEDPQDEATIARVAQAVEAVLVKAAQSDLWSSWVTGLRLPTGRRVLDSAAARALVKMDQDAWKTLASALSLKHSNYAAAPMAELMLTYEQYADADQAQQMWTVMFEVWDAWAYGRDQDDNFHGWLPITVLDFPVAKYYAALDPAARLQEEARLRAEIRDVELSWYPSQSKLITAWNMLRARLRLVEHGASLAAGGNEPLPPAVISVDEYSAIRYRTAP